MSIDSEKQKEAFAFLLDFITLLLDAGFSLNFVMEKGFHYSLVLQREYDEVDSAIRGFNQCQEDFTLDRTRYMEQSARWMKVINNHIKIRPWHLHNSEE